MATDHCSERTRLHRALRQSRRLRVQYARGLSCHESSRSNSRHFQTFRQVKSLELVPIEGPGGRTELPIDVDEPDLRIRGDTTPSGIGFCEVHVCTFALRLDMLAGDFPFWQSSKRSRTLWPSNLLLMLPWTSLGTCRSRCGWAPVWHP